MGVAMANSGYSDTLTVTEDADGYRAKLHGFPFTYHGKTIEECLSNAGKTLDRCRDLLARVQAGDVDAVFEDGPGAP